MRIVLKIVSSEDAPRGHEEVTENCGVDASCGRLVRVGFATKSKGKILPIAIRMSHSLSHNRTCFRHDIPNPIVPVEGIYAEYSKNGFICHMMDKIDVQ